ncbi:MAG: DUF1552 domain-containing protein [Gemmatimonadota bacterium]|nr:DUF1552 domain-containing protein [Gemmatimonadota bacterium]MEC7846660.1 DUF1552 domain-containing protein [Gemmatimonadota bacterium]
MTGPRISRRTVLRGLGASVALPFLDIMEPLALAAQAAAPMADPVKRLAYIYFPNGIPRGAWYPEETAADGRLIRLNEWMSPLEPFKEDILIPSNLWTPQGNGHVNGPPTWLTGQSYRSRAVNAGGVSADQLAARHLGEETLLPSLELSLQGEGYFSNSLPRNAISWSAPDRPMAREIEPRAVFDRMFRPPSGGVTDRSVMDAVLVDARTLRGYTSKADQYRLDEYFESIRALERRIEFSEARSGQMRSDGALTDTMMTPTPGIPADHQSYVRLMLDLMIAAFQSDATRVATFMLDHGQSNRYFDFIPDVQGTWHALSHYQNASGKTEDDDGITTWESVESKRAMYAEVIRWHHTQVAYLLDRMKSIVEPNGGTLLDNSMILYGASLGDGNEHDANDLPTLLAGGGGGTITTGRYIENAEPTDLAGLHLSLLQRMGVEIDEFGTASAPMEGLAV